MKLYIRPLISSLALVLISTGTVRADSAAFWSFDTLTDGTGSFTTAVTAETFAGTPTLTMAGSSLITSGAGGKTFTAFDSSTWTGANNGSSPGHSMGWNAGSTGNFFEVSLDFTELALSTVSMDFRSFTGGITSISLSYSLNGGSSFTSSGLTQTFADTTSAFLSKSYDLSSLTAVANQSSVILRWSFADPTQSFRIDNLQISAITAVPEPAAAGVVAGMGAVLAAACFRRWRMAAARTGI